MKRFIWVVLFILTAAVGGCGLQTGAQSDPGSHKISIVCTTFPQYDWARQILGDMAQKTDLTFLLNRKIDLHSYQPSVDDIVRISTCDLFIYVGGESDKWVGNALAGATNPDMIVINLLDTLGAGAKPEVPFEWETGHSNDHVHHHDDGRAHNDEGILDEHVWLSLINAEVFCTVITDAISALDPDNAAYYNDNLNTYLNKLRALDAQYAAAVDAAPVKALLFGDRFPFRYLTDDYGIICYAAFQGCSAETEASFDTVVSLVKKVDELGLKSVIITESSDQKLAMTVISNTAGKNQQVLVLDAMQSVTLNDVKNGATYLTMMEYNLSVLKDAFR